VKGEYFMKEGRLDTSGCLDFVKNLFWHLREKKHGPLGRESLLDPGLGGVISVLLL